MQVLGSLLRVFSFPLSVVLWYPYHIQFHVFPNTLKALIGLGFRVGIYYYICNRHILWYINDNEIGSSCDKVIQNFRC